MISCSTPIGLLEFLRWQQFQAEKLTKVYSQSLKQKYESSVRSKYYFLHQSSIGTFTKQLTVAGLKIQFCNNLSF
jgi:hypothetical protein